MDIEADYVGATITEIRRNRKTGNLHANIIDKDGKLLVSATLVYCVSILSLRFPQNVKTEGKNV